jgi:ATP-dependent Lon protease
MARFNNKNSTKTSNKTKLRKNKDSDSDDSSNSDESETIDELDSEEEESEYETVSETEEEEEEETTDSSYHPPRKSKRNSKHKSNRKSKYEDEDDSEDDEDEDITPQQVRKLASKLFPSKYIKDKVKRDEELQSKKKSKSSKKDKNKKTKKMNKKRYEEEDDSEEDEEEEDEDEEDEEDEDEEDEDGKNINIIFGFGGDFDEEEENEEAALEDENEECDSDDEKTFMKETYVQLEIPEDMNNDNKVSNKDKKYKNKKSKSKKDKSDKNKTENSEDDETRAKFESEYADLVDMKKYLTDKLQKKPNSKMLLKSLDKCKESIQKLIKKTRTKNTKEYHKLINAQKNKFTSEIDYFKKKLSNKEQLKIMNDLKEINSHIQIDKPYRVALLESQIPTKYKATVMQKLNMLKSMDPSDSEYYKIKNWVDTFMRIPFGKYKALDVKLSDGLDHCHNFMENAMGTLDNCAFGLNDAKMQIMQMVGQWIANPSAMGTAIAIKGPMGTGKTTLVKEGISKILGREFAFIALGGASDSSFLEGHSYTYEGSSWGKIVQILIESKCMNPVIYFDELDKISDTPRGQEIIGILTHLTDTTQNSEFHDKYFSDVNFDLSKCLFIFSYNDESKVNTILKDRMYRIQTKGYNTKEKITIANNYLLPKIREQVSFKEGDVIIPTETLEYIITNQAMTKSEDGVRNLKRCLEIIHTKLNLFRLVKSDKNVFTKDIDIKVEFPFTVSKKDADIFIKNEETQNQSLLAMYV